MSYAFVKMNTCTTGNPAVRDGQGWCILKKFILTTILVLFLSGCGREADQEMLGMSEVVSDMAAAGTADTETFYSEVTASKSSDPGAAQPESGTEADTETMAVFICGAVQKPGVYYFDAGARVCEAVERAGGFTGQADLEWLNQAEYLQDGQKLKIYTREETDAMKENGYGTKQPGDNDQTGQSVSEAIGRTGESASGADTQTAGLVNLNTADKTQLMTLPGIGESRADAVIQYREEHGGFQRIEDIMNISGIKEAVFTKMKDKIAI